jgi:hypothetical protein
MTNLERDLASQIAKLSGVTEHGNVHGMEADWHRIHSALITNKMHYYLH